MCVYKRRLFERDGRKAPFAGSYKPEESLERLNTTANPSGLWKIKFCDGAINDKGILKFVELKFAPLPCKVVEDFYVSRVTASSIEVVWTQPENCVNMQINYQKKGQPLTAKTAFVNCGLGRHTIQGLEKESEYEFYLISSCSASSASAPTCTRSVITACATASLIETFDQQSLCQTTCSELCDITGHFFNSTADLTDWVVNTGNTPTDFTGPSSGINGGGNYIYLESNPALCAGLLNGVLQSRCMRAGAFTTNCDLDFFYHMYGKDIGSLQVLISTDDSNNWVPVFSTSGNKGNEWKRHTASLNLTEGQKFLLAFSGRTSEGSEGDIAIDQITISNANAVEESKFYADNDGDGYGISENSITSCSSIAPQGYAPVGGDCDDDNNLIHPGAIDVPCNLIDENCDGVLSLTDVLNPMSIISIIVKDEQCNGSKDGSISIEVAGGTPPFNFAWLHGDTGMMADSLNSGFYKCKITDFNGCGIETGFIEVKTVSNFQMVVESVMKPTCPGVNNGSISVNHNGAFAPFKYKWSNGDTTRFLSNIGVGIYTLTITDVLGCSQHSASIELTSLSSLQAVATFIKQPLCPGNATGILEVNVVNGNPPYKYLWPDGFTGNRKTQLGEGIYKITITDAIQCTTIFNGVIDAPDELELKLVNIEDVRCFGTRTGQIKTKVTGGTQPYSYAWSDNGSPVQSRNNMVSGTYHVTVYDDNGCSVSLHDIEIKQPPKIEYTIDSLFQSTCLLKDDGSIYTSVTGGVPPYTYFWTGTDQHNDDAINLLPKAYAMTAVDANNCKLTTEAIRILSDNRSYPIKLKVTKANVCPDLNEGEIIAECLEAKLPLDFNWSSGTQHIVNADADTINKLAAGIYSVTITDADGCVSTSTMVTINAIKPFNPGIEVSNNLCNSDKNGLISVEMEGASPPFTISWLDGNTDFSYDSLSNGNYSFKLIDKNGCLFISPQIQISSVSDMRILLDVADSSPGQSNGGIFVSVNGGLGNYDIQWADPGISGFSVENLPPGNYKFSVVDELGCRLDTMATVNLLNHTNQEYEDYAFLFPNPVGQVLTYVDQTKDLQQMRFTFVNTEGKACEPTIINWDTHSISWNMEDISAGVYFISVNEKSAIRWMKFIKL
ncbi:MAG: hypothetical protein IPN29_10050 [Saprospiraceae bacterium]|nr:hypothetical protein [Saprospiraceae bacterium]